MYELLVRIETLCVEVQTARLIGIGAGLAVFGLFLWWGGARYSTIVTGLLGAGVGAVIGLFVGQRLGDYLFVSMAGGAVVVCVASILMRNILIIVLATAVFALVGAASFTSVLMDAEPPQEPSEARRQLLSHSLSTMTPDARLNYVNGKSDPEKGFQGRLQVLLEDTWNALSPYKWMLLASILIGGVGGFLLIWFIKKVVLSLCYSVVGTAGLLLGAQLLLLGLGVSAVAPLETRRWVVPVTAASMAVIGWLRQLLAARAPRPKKPPVEHEAEEETAD